MSNSVMLIAGAYTLMMGWLFLLLLKERSLAVFRAKDMHDKIRESESKTNQRILELLELLRGMMPEQNVKDFVDREFKPVHKSLDELQAGQIKGNEITSQLAANVQVLVDRDRDRAAKK